MSGKSKKVKGTKQTLQFVEEEPKIHVKQIKCLNKRQKDFIQSIKTHDVTVAIGSAGCGKTFLSCYYALKALEKKEFDQIILVKSVTELPGESLGFRQGSEYDKISVFMTSFLGNIDKIIGEDSRKFLIGKNKISLQPIGTLRGVQFDHCLILIDEVQNITMDLFKSIITRIGEGSKMIFMGDEEQIDILNKDKSALSKIIKIFDKDPYVGVVEFKDEDCVRNKIITPILKKLRRYEEEEATTYRNRKKEEKSKDK